MDVESALTLDEAVDTCMLLFADGVENVDSGIGNCVNLLLQHPAVLTRLRSEPELIPDAVEEALRLDPPGQFIAKIAKEDVELAGRLIKKDEAVLLVLASANRDPAVFDEPNEFRLGRRGVRHLSLGQGRHACIGAPLVRMEIEAALRCLLGRVGELDYRDPGLHWQTRWGHRWLDRLPVTFEVRESLAASSRLGLS